MEDSLRQFCSNVEGRGGKCYVIYVRNMETSIDMSPLQS